MNPTKERLSKARVFVVGDAMLDRLATDTVCQADWSVWAICSSGNEG